MKASRIVRVLCVAGLAALSGAALAGERIHFKNGHMLEVKASRLDGDTLTLLLADGAQIGVPANLVEDVEGGRAETVTPGEPLNYSGRGLLLTELNGYKQLTGAHEHVLGGANNLQMSSKPQPAGTFGFSSNGSGDMADRGQGAGQMVRVDRSDDGSAFSARPTMSDIFANRPGAVQKTGKNAQGGAPKLRQAANPDERFGL